MHDIVSILKKLPDAPGIYLFYNKNKKLVYVGKATSLMHRVRSYFSGKKTPRPIEEMIHEVYSIKHIITDSVLEAIILEANYIKKFQPLYNVLGKDDKSWNYIVVTKDTFPQVHTIRQHDMEQETNKKYLYTFGPYPGLNTRVALKILRRIFYFSSCKPQTGKPCLYRQMNQCLGVCTGEIVPRDYRASVIRPLTLFLQGNKKRVIQTFERRMRDASKVKLYEEAAHIRDQLKALYRIQDVALLNETFYTDVFATDTPLVRRIEGYDISNLGSADKVASMVVFDGSGPLKSEYRKFNIKTVVGQSDVDSLVEVFERRLKRTDWQMPDVFLIDGGRPQVNTVKKIFEKYAIQLPLVGIAKGPARKRNDFLLGTKEPWFIQWVTGHQTLLIRVRDEAHRFAITFNRSKRRIKKK